MVPGRVKCHAGQRGSNAFSTDGRGHAGVGDRHDRVVEVVIQHTEVSLDSGCKAVSVGFVMNLDGREDSDQ